MDQPTANLVVLIAVDLTNLVTVDLVVIDRVAIDLPAVYLVSRPYVDLMDLVAVSFTG